MATETTLPIAGYRDEPVPNRFIRPRGATDRLAVLLPGFGYNCDMPLFYYTENMLTERGWDILRVDYAYSRNAEFRNSPDAEREHWLLADVDAAWSAGVAQGTYGEVALIGKSLGTLAMGHLLTTVIGSNIAWAVWLTPLLGDARRREQIERSGAPSLFVIGTADPHYDAVMLARMVEATGGEAVVIDGADHGMDIPGDPVASVQGLERIVAALARFLPANDAADR
ncbi:MAG TPA: alpha/beta family hydrolase [Thermomicrobiales bacterium]|nr:alpha/beta family hydrolase [Thermomicrobiales bacterium]